MTNLYKEASRISNLTFDTKKGPIRLEDLWTLSLTSTTQRVSLDEIAIDLNRKIQQTSVSFVDATTTADKELRLKFDLVLDIIETIKQENQDRLARKAAADEENEKAKIRSEIIHEMQVDKMREEVKAELGISSKSAA